MSLHNFLTYGLIILLSIFLSCNKPEESSIFQQEYLAVANKLDHSISLVNLSTNRVEKTIQVGRQPHEVAVSKDNKYLAVSNYDSPHLSLIDIRTLEKRTVKINNAINLHGIKFIGNTHSLAITNEGHKELLIYDIPSNKIKSRISLKEDKPHRVTVSKSGQFVFVSNYESGTVTKIDLENNRIIKTVKSGQGAEGLCLNSSGTKLWVVNRLENSINVFDTESMNLLEKINSQEGPVRIAISPNDQIIVIINADANSISLINNSDHKIISSIDLKLQPQWLFDAITKTPRPVGVVFHPNNDLIFVSASNADKVYCINLTSNKIIARIDVGDIPDGIVFFNKNDN